MSRTFPHIPSLPLFIALAITVAMFAFGATRWISSHNAEKLPALDLPADIDAAKPGALNTQALMASRAPSTVMIDSVVGEDALTGAGVVVSTDGIIVTASHVIHNYQTNEDASSILVSLTTNGIDVNDEVEAKVISRDRYNDLAVLKVDPSKLSKPLVAATLATTELLPGSEIAAIGYPRGEMWTVTKGIVSNVHRSIPSRINPTWNIPDAVQFDAAINPGNSGGPLFNARGEVVGIVQQISSETESNTGISFAISAQIVARTVRLSATASDIPYSYAGLQTRTLSPQLAKAVGATTKNGAVVQSAEGPAARAGLQTGAAVAYAGESVRSGDIVVSVAGQKVTSSSQVDRLLGLSDPNAAIRVDVIRNGRQIGLNLVPDRRA